MDTSKYIKGTLWGALGLASSSTQATPHYTIALTEMGSVESHSSSTKFINTDMFSLEQLKSNKLKLRSFSKLAKGWNGYGGDKIEDEVIKKVIRIISTLDFQPEIFPTGRGSIQLEKYFDDDNLVEIEIDSRTNHAYQVRKGVEYEHEVDDSQINNLISELYV